MTTPHFVAMGVFVAALAAQSSLAGTPAAFTEEAGDRELIYAIDDVSQAPGFGCAFVDLDEDGDLDVVLLGDPGGAAGAVGIFENDGTGHFTDHTATSGIPAIAQAAAVSAGDYDGDGDQDLFLTSQTTPDVLARNDGGFTFTNVAADAGVAYAGPSEAGSWADFDGDGDLDLYLAVYVQGIELDPLVHNRLYLNLGDGTFDEVAAAFTVNDLGYGFQSVWTDYDRDGDVDLYLSNDRGGFKQYPTNQLWRNDGLTMTNVSVGSGADVGIWSMGVACGDFDGNGWPDLYCTNIQSGPNPLLLNQGDGTFDDQAAAAGVDQFITSWGAIFFDFDNDGTMELYVNNDFMPNKLWAQNSGFPCVDLAPTVGLQGTPWTCCGGVGRSYSSAIGDVDGDGDLDLLESNLGHNVQLYINHEGQTRSSVRLRVVGEPGNLHAVGASIDTRIGKAWHFREILAGGNGYLGQNELTVHVGADAAGQADEVVVSWPGGTVTRTLTNIPVDETWAVYPPSRLGDSDGDGLRLHDDYLVLEGCYGQPITPGCEMMDFDGDSDVDADDALAFFAAYDDKTTDCNRNMRADVLDILLQPQLDGNGNGIIDACEVPGDATGDGVVNVDDLVLVIQTWGPCPGGAPWCPGDVNGDGEVDVDDLVAVIQGWT